MDSNKLEKKNADEEISKSTPILLTLDYALIDEALRRLVDGTCCLVDEEKMAAFELFHKLREALVDHIQFEEETVFPALTVGPGIASVDDFVSSMTREHSRLNELLLESRRELEDSRGTAFRALLRELIATLTQHRKLEESISYPKRVSTLGDENMKRVIARSHDGFLK